MYRGKRPYIGKGEPRRGIKRHIEAENGDTQKPKTEICKSQEWRCAKAKNGDVRKLKIEICRSQKRRYAEAKIHYIGGVFGRLCFSNTDFVIQ